MNHNIAFVQARMGSKRFPGKMTKKLGEFTLLEWVLIRLKKSKLLNQIILTTSTNKENDELISYAKKLNIDFFRGEENNVLNRFTEASLKYKPINVIRVCGDNPFIDGNEIDKLINFFQMNSCDYAFNHLNKLNSNYADGFGAEITSFEILIRLNKVAKDNDDREHIFNYIWKNQTKFRIKPLKANRELAYPNLKFDIDTEEDFQKINNLVNKGVRLDSKASDIIKINQLN